MVGNSACIFRNWWVKIRNKKKEEKTCSISYNRLDRFRRTIRNAPPALRALLQPFAPWWVAANGVGWKYMLEIVVAVAATYWWTRGVEGAKSTRWRVKNSIRVVIRFFSGKLFRLVSFFYAVYIIIFYYITLLQSVHFFNGFERLYAVGAYAMVSSRAVWRVKALIMEPVTELMEITNLWGGEVNAGLKTFLKDWLTRTALLVCARMCSKNGGSLWNTRVTELWLTFASD